MPRSMWLIAVVVLGCAPSADPRFARPETTIRTLLGTYGLADVPETAIRERLASGAGLTLHDPATFHDCFADFDRPDDEGLAGYILGSVSAAKDSLSIEVDDGAGRATIRLGHDSTAPRLVLRHQPDGWRVVLAESVPAEVQEQLRAIHRRAEARLRLGS